MKSLNMTFAASTLTGLHLLAAGAVMLGADTNEYSPIKRHVGDRVAGDRPAVAALERDLRL